jgi:hypothetical protein
MARPLRVENPGAIYHVMTLGNRRQIMFGDEADYRRFFEGLEQTGGSENSAGKIRVCPLS